MPKLMPLTGLKNLKSSCTRFVSSLGSAWGSVPGFALAFAIAATSLLGLARAQAYPNFIGYGYTTCTVCHYNTLGNGPLTDYGRALFAQEIASRMWLPKSVTDEDLGRLSSFIPGVELPFWIRPSLKYRGFYYKQSPNSGNAKHDWINMERDANVVFAFDRDSRTIVSATYGVLDKPKAEYKPGHITDNVSREHYLRFYASENVLVQVGLFDKAYGIRTSDHTSLSRDPLNLGYDSQVHGVMVQYLKEKYDFAVQGFVGNLLKDKPRRESGFAATGEYEVAERNRLGSSLLLFSTDIKDAFRFAIHDRWGMPRTKGSSLMAELGIKQDSLKTGSATNASLGNYAYVEALILLVRGYNFQLTIERAQGQNSSVAPSSQRMTVGFLTFPLQRSEFRLTAVQQKTFSPSLAADDGWSLQGQFHVSL